MVRTSNLELKKIDKMVKDQQSKSILKITQISYDRCSKNVAETF